MSYISIDLSSKTATNLLEGNEAIDNINVFLGIELICLKFEGNKFTIFFKLFFTPSMTVFFLFLSNHLLIIFCNYYWDHCHML